MILANAAEAVKMDRVPSLPGMSKQPRNIRDALTLAMRAGYVRNLFAQDKVKELQAQRDELLEPLSTKRLPEL